MDVDGMLVTYSPAYTLVPTYECFNRCGYCNFRADPGQDAWLSLNRAQAILDSLQGTGVTEILILSGEVHPHSPRRRPWLQLLVALGQLALQWGFFPHTNAGPLTREEMAIIRQVNSSMGLMVEQINGDLRVHWHAPSKNPTLRLQQLRWAGEMAIPFTTGLLLGIGESAQDRTATLRAIADLQTEYGHIQEVILQPHSPGQRQPLDLPLFPTRELPALVAEARQILPPTVTVQIPPNLIAQDELLLSCLQAGARDLGGIGPWDEVNPQYGHRSLEHLRSLLATEGWNLVPRLPVYGPSLGEAKVNKAVVAATSSNMGIVGEI